GSNLATMAPHSTADERRRLETLGRSELEAFQLARLNALLEQMLPANEFYAQKLAQVKRPVESLEELASWPFTYKEELAGSPQNANFVQNLTWPADRYTRYHQTSGTSGHPMVVLDSPEDWHWILECWEYVLDAAEVTREDRALM